MTSNGTEFLFSSALLYSIFMFMGHCFKTGLQKYENLEEKINNC